MIKGSLSAMGGVSSSWGCSGKASSNRSGGRAKIDGLGL
jgi:hypothetical protein